MEDILQTCQEHNVKTSEINEEIWFCAFDIGRELGLKNSYSSIALCPRNDRRNISCQDASGRFQPMTFINRCGVQRLICRSRSIKAGNLAKAFDINVINSHIVPVESDTLQFIMTIFEGETMIPQFICGIYRIDLYFADYRIAVECDEAGSHGLNTADSDRKRQQDIEEELSCEFVRYRPNAPDFNIARVANEIYIRIKQTPNTKTGPTTASDNSGIYVQDQISGPTFSSSSISSSASVIIDDVDDSSIYLDLPNSPSSSTAPLVVPEAVELPENRDTFPCIQQYDANDFSKLIASFGNMSDAARKTGFSKTDIKESIDKYEEMEGFRFTAVPRDKKDTIVELKPTVISKKRNHGWVAKMTLDKTKVIAVHQNATVAAASLHLKKDGIIYAMNNKEGIKNGYFWTFWKLLSKEQKDSYDGDLTALKKQANSSKAVLQIDKDTGEVVKKWAPMTELQNSNFAISHQTVQKYSSNQKIYKGYRWKIV